MLAQRAPDDEVAHIAVQNAATKRETVAAGAVPAAQVAIEANPEEGTAPTPPPAEADASINKPSSELVMTATASSGQRNYRREGALDAENGREAAERAVRRNGG